MNKKHSEVELKEEQIYIQEEEFEEDTSSNQ